MSKRAREKRTQQTEQEQFEAYGEYTYNYLHTMDGGSGEPAVQPSAQAVRRAQKRRRTHGFFKFLGLLTVLTIALGLPPTGGALLTYSLLWCLPGALVSLASLEVEL